MERVTHVNIEARDQTGSTALILAALTGTLPSSLLVIALVCSELTHVDLRVMSCIIAEQERSQTVHQIVVA